MADKKKSLNQLIAAFNKSPKDQTTREELRAHVGSVACFVLVDGKPHPGESHEAFDFHRDTGMSVDGALTFDEMLRQSAPEHEADPVTGRPLFKGRTTDGLKVDWSQVPRDRRLVAAFAAESGQLPMGATSETVAEALREETPRAPWPRLIEAWDKLRASTKPADRARVIEIEARLTFAKGAAEEERGPFSDPVAAASIPDSSPSPGIDSTALYDRLNALLPAQFDNVVFRVGCPSEMLPSSGEPQARRSLALVRWAQAGGHLANLAQRVGMIVQPASRRPVGVVILASRADSAFVDALRRHLAPMERSGLIAMATEPPVGAYSVSSWFDGQIRSADIVLALSSASLAIDCDRELTVAVQARATGTRLVPVQIRPCEVDARLNGRSIPYRPVGQAGNDDAWVEVAVEIRKLATAISR